METARLALLEHENWIAYLAASVSLNPDGLFLRDRGITTLLGGVPMRFFNQILVEGSDAAASAIRDAVANGRARRDPFVVSLRESLDDRFAPMLGELGLAATEDAMTRAMALYPLRDRTRRFDGEAGLAIRRVTDESGLEDHRRIVSMGFGADASVADAMLGIGLLDRTECAVYVGYEDGTPVTSGLAWRTGRTIGVYNIATVPVARRRGFGEAMTARVLVDGAAAGCDVAVLQASSMGRSIYERLGFRMAVRYTGYVDPEHPEG
jgi:ribosomal protein S18 acetylase RimI-like enzyme